MKFRQCRSLLFLGLASVCFQLTGAFAMAAEFDTNDKANLKIYTAQGYYINSELRSRIPLTSVANLIDLKASPTCGTLIKANAPYLSQIEILPFRKFKATDFKLYSLVQDALISRGRPAATTVYRGAHSCDFLLNSQGQPVKHHLEKAFLSTSIKEEVAQRFTVPMNMMNENKEASGCLMKIEGLSGVPIAKATGNFNGEEEVLFPAGALFEVRDFQMNGQQRIFTLREIDKSSGDYTSIRTALEKEVARAKVMESYPELAAANFKAGASKQLNADAESACHEAYLFLTTNPEVRKSITAKKPAYDLSNKKLNPEDYVVEE